MRNWKIRKRESAHIQGMCVTCNKRKQKIRGWKDSPSGEKFLVYKANCWSCDKRRYPTSSASHRRRQLRRYGLSVIDFAAMSRAQCGRCAICLRKPQKLFVDHNHETGAIRGLLCHGCNVSLGMMKEKILAMQNMIKYVQFYAEP